MICELLGNNGIDLGNGFFSDDGVVTQCCGQGVFGERKK